MADSSRALIDAKRELQRLQELDRQARITAELFIPPALDIQVLVAAPSYPAIQHSSSQPSTEAVHEPATSTRQRTFVESPLTETAEQEIKRLELTVNNLTEINDRVMTQNIALLHDLEACQRAVRDLRAEKDAMAVQLKRALTKA